MLCKWKCGPKLDAIKCTEDFNSSKKKNKKKTININILIYYMRKLLINSRPHNNAYVHFKNQETPRRNARSVDKCKVV